jgi:fumarate reductase subunit D
MTRDIIGAALFLAFLVVTLWLSGFYIDHRLNAAEMHARCVYGCDPLPVHVEVSR